MFYTTVPQRFKGYDGYSVLILAVFTPIYSVDPPQTPDSIYISGLIDRQRARDVEPVLF